MEEWVGDLWHRWITKVARQDYPEAAVRLSTMSRRLSVVFRAMGGDPGLSVQGAVTEQHQARRRWLERVAGTGQRVQHARLDGQVLRLPDELAVFPDAALNEDLYVWLAALAAHTMVAGEEDPFVRNQRATVVTLHHFPALSTRYERLVAALLAQRRAPKDLPADEAAQERAIRQALQQPGSCLALPPLVGRKSRPVQPVPLWILPLEGAAQRGVARQHQESAAAEGQNHEGTRKQAEQVESPEQEHGLLMLFRAESLFSWAEYVRVNRDVDDEPDPNAGAAAESLDQLSVMQDGQAVASKVRFDLDLPAAHEDDAVLGEGIPQPEWDYRSQRLLPDHCRIVHMAAREVTGIPLPDHLRAQARKLRSQFAALVPTRRWQKGMPEGSELDLDAWVRQVAAGRAGGLATPSDERIYQAQVQQERDLACLVLADLSLSTDAGANDQQKVIDVIRDSLMLFAEALGETGDAFALFGFSSLKRSHVRMHALKSFQESYSPLARGRIDAIRPGYYTRLGAAIRYCSQQLAKQPQAQRLLLILSDGKPHDLDVYESRYGVEDTRHSILAAQAMGVRPFCVTIDREGGSYLPHMFGAGGFMLLRRADELTQKLPMLYAQLTRS